MTAAECTEVVEILLIDPFDGGKCLEAAARAEVYLAAGFSFWKWQSPRSSSSLSSSGISYHESSRGGLNRIIMLLATCTGSRRMYAVCISFYELALTTTLRLRLMMHTLTSYSSRGSFYGFPSVFALPLHFPSQDLQRRCCTNYWIGPHLVMCARYHILKKRTQAKTLPLSYLTTKMLRFR